MEALRREVYMVSRMRRQGGERLRHGRDWNFSNGYKNPTLQKTKGSAPARSDKNGRSCDDACSAARGTGTTRVAN